MSVNVRKRTFGHVRPTKIQIRLRMHSRSLIRIFTGRILDRQRCKISSCRQRRLWSDCTDAQADFEYSLGAHWVCMYIFLRWSSKVSITSLSWPPGGSYTTRRSTGLLTPTSLISLVGGAHAARKRPFLIQSWRPRLAQVLTFVFARLVIGNVSEEQIIVTAPLVFPLNVGTSFEPTRIEVYIWHFKIADNSIK